MKEKILTQIKSESTVITDQETLCANINNLSGSLSSLSDIDSTLLDDQDEEKLRETKLNILSAIHYYSKYLQTED
jgi:hypothetical protein